MLEGRGIDFETIGMAMGYAKDIRAIERDAISKIEAGNRISARYYAMLQGRTAQLQVLYEALLEVDPHHPAIQPTGRLHPDGSDELQFEAVFASAYDPVADRNGIPRTRQPMLPADRAFADVMSEEIEERRFLFSRRFFYRGSEHRSRAGAERARRLAAETARQENL